MEESYQREMAELASLCRRDIEIQEPKIDAALSSFRRSLQSIKSKSDQAAENQRKLEILKTQLREAEDQLVKTLAVKTRKEAKRMAVMDSMSLTKAKVEELHRTLQDQKNREEEYARIISQHLEVLTTSEEKIRVDAGNREEFEEACAWYNNVLGLRIEGGLGVKFTFTNINRKCLSEEYSFTVRHSNDVYSLLDCNPHLNDIKELVDELNKTNGLFKFVRLMRAKFQQASASGSIPMQQILTSPIRNADVQSVSAPSSLLSADNSSETPQPLRESNSSVGRPEGARKPLSVLSPGHRRRSPRFNDRK